MGWDARMLQSVFGAVERLERVVIASVLACGVPSPRIWTRRGTAVVEAMTGLLLGEAERVRMAAVACSCRVEFGDRRKEMRGSRAPASTILVLLLQVSEAKQGQYYKGQIT